MIAFAESSNKSMAACHFSFNKKHVHEWGKRQRKIAEMPKSKKAACCRRPIFDALKKRLTNWIQESRLNGPVVVCMAISIALLAMAPQRLK